MTIVLALWRHNFNSRAKIALSHNAKRQTIVLIRCKTCIFCGYFPLGRFAGSNLPLSSPKPILAPPFSQ